MQPGMQALAGGTAALIAAALATTVGAGVDGVRLAVPLVGLGTGALGALLATVAVRRWPAAGALPVLAGWILGACAAGALLGYPTMRTDDGLTGIAAVPTWVMALGLMASTMAFGARGLLDRPTVLWRGPLLLFARGVVVWGSIHVALWVPILVIPHLNNLGFLPEGDWVGAAFLAAISANVVGMGALAVVAPGPVQAMPQFGAAIFAPVALLSTYPQVGGLLRDAARGQPESIGLILLPVLVGAAAAAAVALRLRVHTARKSARPTR